MIVQRGYRYRIYPTPEIEEVLREWERTHRFVWNVALRQRRLSSKQIWNGTDWQWVRLPPSDYYWQQAYLTKMRSNPRIPWVGEGLCRSEQCVLRDLNAAWKMWVKDETRGRPKFKKMRDTIGMTVTVEKSIPLSKVVREGQKVEKPRRKNDLQHQVLIPKLGWIDIILHRPLSAHRALPFDGRPMDAFTVKRMSVTREGSAWFVAFLCEYEVTDPGKSRKPAVGIDRGVVLNLADSDGRMSKLPARIAKLARRIDRLQAANDRKIVSHKKGVPRSNNWRKGQEQISKLHTRVRRMRRQWLHHQALYYAENYGVVVIEDLKIKNMTKSAKGTEEEPGSNVRQKAGLNRAILRQGWSAFVSILCYKMEERGGVVVKVPPRNTSITCPKCGHVSADNRRSQSKFRCVECEHEENADINAAREILRRYHAGDYKLEGGYAAKKEPKIRVALQARGRKKTTAIPRGKGSQDSCPVPAS